MSGNNSARLAAYDAATAVKAAEVAVDAAASIPKPPPPAPRFDLVRGEQSALARVNPRRNRWPGLQAIDERVGENEQRSSKVMDELSDLHLQLAEAGPAHQLALAAWLEQGQRGERPEPPVEAIEKRIRDLQDEHEALHHLQERILEERVEFVRRHRGRLVKDATKEAEKTKRRYLQLVDELEQVRDDLVGANETRIWAALFPSEHLATMAPANNLVGAIKRHMRQWLPGVEQGLEARGVFGLLRVDAEHFSKVMTTPQAAASKGVSEGELTGEQALWADSPEYEAQQRREREQLYENYKREWGRYPQ